MVRNLPVRTIVGAIDAAAARWSDASFAPRVRARDTAGARSGYTLSVVDHAFDRLFTTLRQAAIERVLDDELGSADALDRFVPRRGRPAARALGLGRVCVISSRTTLGVAILPAVFALCAKCTVLVKDREDALVEAFFTTLAEELPELRPFAQARSWNGEADLREAGSFDAVVAFGNDATMCRVASSLPFPTRFIGYGARASAGYVARDALHSEASAREIARGAARDLLLYDGEGCLSLHALFVERGGAVAPERFVELLDAAAAAASIELPPGRRDARAIARVGSARDLARFRGDDRVYGDAHGSYVLMHDPPLEEPPLFLPRTLGIHTVDAPEQAVSYLRDHGVAIEAFALAGRRDDLLDAAIAAGASRIARLGALQSPPLGAFHGGRPRVAEFVRWIGDES